MPSLGKGLGSLIPNKVNKKEVRINNDLDLAHQINYLPLDEIEAKSNLDIRVIMNKKPGAVYLDYGAGLWRLESITENLTQVSYALYMDSGGLVTDNLNDLFTSQFIVKFYKEVLEHSRK